MLGKVTFKSNALQLMLLPSTTRRVSITLQIVQIKIANEKCLMEMSISQKLPHIAKMFLRSHRVVFQAIRKGIIHKSTMESFFFACTGHVAYVKSHTIII